MLVFISYPREFEEAAAALDEELASRNVKTFRDREDISGGEVWALKIESSVKQADAFVVFYLPSASDHFFNFEIEQIRKVGETDPKRIITVLFPPARPEDLPEFLKRHTVYLAENEKIEGDETRSYIGQIVQQIDSLHAIKNDLRLNPPKIKQRLLVGAAVIAVILPLITVRHKAEYLGAPSERPPIDWGEPLLFPDPFKGSSHSGLVLSNEKDEGNYKLVLGADKRLTLSGTPGELRVWIGSPLIDPRLPSRMAQAGRLLPAVGRTAKVTPFAPAFEIDPKESICMGIHPSGSETQFKLTPKETGTFDVGANVLLFSGSDCSGTPVPKSAETLQVTVVVNSDKAFKERTKQFVDIFWEKLLEFWGLLVALFFALLLFLVRGRLKKWFSFGEDK